MSIAKLKATRDKVVNDGIGVYLPVMKTVLGAIDEHIAENGAQPVDNTLPAKVTVLEEQVAELKQQVEKLKAENAMLTTVAKEAISEVPSASTTEVVK